MKDFIEYLMSTGEIKFTGVCSDPSLQQGDWSPLNATIEGSANGRTQYVDIDDNNIVKDKVPMPLAVSKTTLTADGIDMVTISNIPIGTLYVNDSVEFIIDDGILEFTTDIPRNYSLNFSGAKYLPEEVILVAT